MPATTNSKSSSNDSIIDTVMLALANIYDQMGQTNSAFGIYNSIIKRNPACVKALYSRGLILMSREEDDQGMRDLHKAASLGSRDKCALRSRALGHVFQGNFEAAAKDMTKALESNDWDALTCLIAYVVYQKAGLNDQSVQVLNDSLDGKLNSSDWPTPVLQYLRGDFSLSDLMGIANATKGRILETRGLLGFVRSLGNNEQESKPDLQFVRDSNQGTAIIRAMAIRQLIYLEKGLDALIKRRSEKADRTSGMDWMS